MSDVHAEVHLWVTVSDCSWAVVVILFTSIHCWVVCWCGLVRTICFTVRVTNASWRQTSQIRLQKRRMKRTLLTVTVWSSWSSRHIPAHCLPTVTKPFRTEPFIAQHLLFFALVVRGLRLIRMAMHIVLNNSSWPIGLNSNNVDVCPCYTYTKYQFVIYVMKRPCAVCLANYCWVET